MIMTQVTALEIKNITKVFELGGGNRVTAVQDVNFKVEQNSICVLLGPSGCGKSTILRMMAGLEIPTKGEIAIGGRTVDGPGRDRGMVFQAYTSFDWLSVRKNVEFGMKINGIDPDERRERAERFINLVGLGKFADVYPSQLSGGMRQRVAIARTLANDPEVLLMDEPFGALDAETRWLMQELMINVAEQTNTTMVIVTHDLEEAIFLADKIVFLSSHPGRVKEEIVPEFKQGQRIADKERAVKLDGYAELESRLMRLMREEGRGVE
ncbi:Bicarbonate transport ATP-binding protein CmpC [Thalassovita gelatinovora]|uniref:Bicarbonate transport ATP-binding protein CmpC n=2 Tax=Thalassovita gelatinovora TaxID=53501 RepID=A0A0P1G180_THAGE|nr:Bicarbonate transport ATP-binding protein CmpC [Thalassovita gelatinovora]SER08708.1 NitT/TauT family transport system ATP-binding protein [Thalassovita gelatinovora]